MPNLKSRLLYLFTSATPFLSSVRAFSVTVGTPTQCDDLTVSWTGGQAPFEIIVTPFAPSQPLDKISVPASAFSNGKGSYSISQFSFKDGTQFLLTMSDATGFGSGGTSTILGVGAPVVHNNCSTTIPSPDFFFSTPLELQQCNDFTFTAYDGAIQPVTITGLIPGGKHFVLSPPTGPDFTWVADIEAGAQVIFYMMDSQGRQGGVSTNYTVQPLANTSHLGVGSPSSIASAPSQTSSQSSNATTVQVGIIAGTAVGGVVLLVVLIIVGIWCIRRASSRQSRAKDDCHDIKHNLPSHQRDGSHIPFMQPGTQTPMSGSDPFSQHLRQISYKDSFAGNSSLSSASRLITVAGSQTASSHTSPHQTLSVGLTPPIHTGTHSHVTKASTASFAANGHCTPFNQFQPSRSSSKVDTYVGYGKARHSSTSTRQMAGGQTSPDYTFPYQARPVSYPAPPNRPGTLSSKVDAYAGYGNAGHSSTSSARQIAGGQTSPDYTFPYQARPVSYPVPPNQPGTLSHYASDGSFAVSDLPSQSPTQPSLPSSNIDGSASSSSGGRMTAGTSQAPSNPQIIVHIDIEDIQEVIELPPQYTDRQLPAPQRVSAPRRKSPRS